MSLIYQFEHQVFVMAESQESSSWRFETHNPRQKFANYATNPCRHVTQRVTVTLTMSLYCEFIPGEKLLRCPCRSLFSNRPHSEDAALYWRHESFIKILPRVFPSISYYHNVFTDMIRIAIQVSHQLIWMKWALTHWGRVTHICVSNLYHHWFR